jgi:hypothetical protein
MAHERCHSFVKHLARGLVAKGPPQPVSAGGLSKAFALLLGGDGHPAWMKVGKGRLDEIASAVQTSLN